MLAMTAASKPTVRFATASNASARSSPPRVRRSMRMHECSCRWLFAWRAARAARCQCIVMLASPSSRRRIYARGEPSAIMGLGGRVQISGKKLANPSPVSVSDGRVRGRGRGNHRASRRSKRLCPGWRAQLPSIAERFLTPLRRERPLAFGAYGEPPYGASRPPQTRL